MENAIKNSLRIIFRPINLWWLFLFGFLFAVHAINPFNSDEGVMLEGARNLVYHQKLYLDFFEFVPPAGFYFIYGVWKIMGISYFAAKLASLILLAIGGVGIYRISRKLDLGKTAFIPVTLYFVSSVAWPIINYNTFNAVFLIWAVYFFINFIQHSKQKWLILSGIFVGISILFTQHKGIALGGAGVIFMAGLFIKEKTTLWLKSIFIYALSAMAPLLVLLFWPPKIIINNLILFPATNYWATNIISYYLIILIAIIILWLGIFVYRKNWDKSIAFLFIAQIALLIACLPRPDYYHIFVVLFPLYILILKAYEKIKNSFSYLRYTYSAICFIILIIIVQFFLTTFLAQLKFYSGDILHNDLMQYLQENCLSPYIYAGPFIPGIYFESGKLNATPYPLLITRQQTDWQFRDAESNLKLHEPDCAVMQYAMVEKFGYNKNNPVDNYINANYHLEKKLGNLLIYKINHK